MLYMLKFQDVLESNIMIKGIAIVKSTANKSTANKSTASSCKSFGDRCAHVCLHCNNLICNNI